MSRHALSPELQRLVNEPLSEPPPRARSLWKALERQLERLGQARVQQAEFEAEANRLREELNLAHHRDQRALGEALAAGLPEPKSEGAAIEADIERNVQRSAAMLGVIADEQRAVAKLVLRCKDAWRKDLARHIADGAAAYRTAIVALEQYRAALVELVQVGGWLETFPQTGGQVQTAQLAGDRRLVDPLTGRPEPVAVLQRTFSEVFNDLLRDSEELPLLGPVQPTREFMRWLDRDKIVLDRVDSDGSVHPQVFEGDTREGWLVRDFLNRHK